MSKQTSEKSRYLEGDPKTVHISSYRDLTGIWIGLLMLTTVTVLVSYMHNDFKAFSVLMALIIASAKAIVVINHFMHLKFDSKVIKIMVYVVFGVFTVLIVLTGIDYFTRA